jgi:uracil-DNA glycosylase
MPELSTALPDAMEFRKILKCFYVKQGIAVGDFRCKNQESCHKKVGRKDLCWGSEAHVGSQYGTPFRIVIVSLDRGTGSDNIEDRSRAIEGLQEGNLNPHMKGTLQTLRAILARPEPGTEVFRHFAMTNAAKCSYRQDGMTSVPDALYRNCSNYGKRELEALKPHLIVTQGQRAIYALDGTGKQMEPSRAEELTKKYLGADANRQELRQLIRDLLVTYVGSATLNQGEAVWLRTPHPSARAGQWQHFAKFHLPILSAFVRDLAMGSRAICDCQGDTSRSKIGGR